MSQKQYETLMREYVARKKKSEDQYKTFKEMMNNARTAYKQKIPSDISAQASNESLLTGNAGNEDNGCSKMLIPMFTAIAKKTIENLTAMPPRYEWDSNNRDSLKTARALEKELAKFYTKTNIGRKMSEIMWHFVVSGMFAQQTVFKELTEKVRKFDNGRADADIVYNGGAIDFVVYDPLTCYFDWDADLTDMRRTSKYFIATISDCMTEWEVERRYGDGFKKEGVSALRVSDTSDVLKMQQRQLSNTVPDTGYVVREYYTNDGKFYTIINDSYVARWSWASNGVMDQIPINIGISFMDSDNNCGTNLWDLVKYCIAAMSNAFNQVADNNAFNNTAPIFMLGTADLSALSLDTADGRKVFQLTSPNKQARIQDILMQFQLPEVTVGAQWMYDQAKASLFYVTGTNDMAFGIQDKQIRNENVAQMISDSLVRPDSDIAKRVEETLLNPITWDFLRIFYTRYDSFTFNKTIVPRDFLKNHRSIRVINGSYLASDKMVRLGKLQQALQYAQLIPDRMNLEELFYDLIESIGFPDPYRYLKTQEEFIAQEYVQSVQLLLSQGAIDQNQAGQMLEAINLIEKNKDKFQEKE